MSNVSSNYSVSLNESLTFDADKEEDGTTTTTPNAILNATSWRMSGAAAAMNLTLNSSVNWTEVGGTSGLEGVPLWGLSAESLEFSSQEFNLSSSSTGLNNTSLPNYPGWGDSMYPSGYTTLGIIIAAIFVTSLMIVVVVGNMLVIIAIVTERTLKTIQNWFIASLAVSDFLLGLVVMPFSLANELMGYWIFGFWWCEIHLAVDVLLCTASILNICMISLDRYWSITKAVEYLRQRTPMRAALMISFVWILSFVISVPPLLGWRKPDDPKDYPICQVSDDMGYVIYSALGSFYIPSVIMVFVYIRIWFAARSRARRAMKKRNVTEAVKDKSTTTTSFSNPSPPDKNKNNPTPKISGGGDTLTVPTFVPPDSISECGEENSKDTSNDGATTPQPEPTDCEGEKGRENGSAKTVAIVTVTTSSPQRLAGEAGAGTQDDADCVSELEHSSDSDQQCRDYKGRVPLRRLRQLCRPPNKKTSKARREEVDLGKLVPKIRDPEREKRRLARKKERRATLILGLIMASFILCWLPFFLTYLLSGLCKTCPIPELAFAIAFWLGYCNSALNPIIYTIFNKDFRRAFRKILFK